MASQRLYFRSPSEWRSIIIAASLAAVLLLGCATVCVDNEVDDVGLHDFVMEYRKARTDRERYLVMKRVAYAINPDLSGKSRDATSLCVDRNQFIMAFGPPDRVLDRRIDYLYMIDSVRVFAVCIGFDAHGKTGVAMFTSYGWGQTIDLAEEVDVGAFLRLYSGNYDIVLSKFWVDAFALENATVSECCSAIMGKVNDRIESIGCKGVEITVENDDNRRFSFAFRGGCVQSLLKEMEGVSGYSPIDNFGELRKDPSVKPVIVLRNCRHALHTAGGSNCVY